MKHLRTATLSGDAEINGAIATLVLAFAADPVARWMYRPRDQYLRHIPRLFRALGAGSFEAGAAHRSANRDGFAIWFPRECTATLHLLKRSSQTAWLEICKEMSARSSR